jgi:rfaE bifunctional protein nucleotidyltransferase chain/domain
MKILSFETLVRVVHEQKSRGYSIVHCHGCFDLLHVGHIKYFQAARKMGDILVVTVTPDRFVDKGPNRPAFCETLRVDAIAALECISYVSLNLWPTAEETLRQLGPTVYVKGQEFQNLEDPTGKIQKEYEVVREIGARIQFTQEIVFSSTKLLDTHFKKP